MHFVVEDWNSPGMLPPGWAGLASMAIGLIGVGLGASQVAYQGLLAQALSGMDVGFEVGIVFAGIAYFFLRRIEINTSGRPMVTTAEG